MQTPQNLAVMSMDDIVFAGRNQSYGAYMLRQSYHRYLLRALLAACAFFVLALISPLVLARLDDTSPKLKWSGPIEIQKPPVLEKPIEIPPPTPVIPVAPSIRYVEPVIVEDAKAKNAEEMPPMDDIKQSNPGTQTLEGDPEVIDIPDVVDIKKAEVEAPKVEKPYLIVEVMPQFPGGMKEFSRFLQKNLRYPRAAEKSGTEGRITLSFVVSPTGDISDIQVIKGIGFGCDEEAVRVLSKMPAWSPGIQGGRKVPVRYTLPVTFALGRE